jgi:hypothetical protein
MMIRQSIVLIAAVLAGCASAPQRPPINVNDPTQMQALTTVERDNFKKQTNYTGFTFISGEVDRIFLRATKFDSGAPSFYQIYVVDTYGDQWRFYSTAHDNTGARLDTVSIARDVDCRRYGCDYHEHVGITVSRAYLEAATAKGLHIQVSGRAGQVQFAVSPGYIAGFLAATR